MTSFSGARLRVASKASSWGGRPGVDIWIWAVISMLKLSRERLTLIVLRSREVNDLTRTSLPGNVTSALGTARSRVGGT
jgi:hypothetical protein